MSNIDGPIVDIRGHVDRNNNRDNCHQLDINYDNTNVPGLESFKTVYGSPTKRLIRYIDQTPDAITISVRDHFNLSAPPWCTERKLSAHPNPYFATDLFDVPHAYQAEILQRINTQKEREAFVVRLLRRPWTDTKMPCMPKFISREQLRFFQKNGKVRIVFHASVVCGYGLSVCIGIPRLLLGLYSNTRFICTSENPRSNNSCLQNTNTTTQTRQ